MVVIGYSPKINCSRRIKRLSRKALASRRFFGNVCVGAGVAAFPLIAGSSALCQDAGAFSIASQSANQSAGSSVSGVLSAGVTTHVTTTDPGKPSTETLRGNGGRLGYKLAHGNVLTDTVSVHVGVGLMRQGVDYWIDADTGSLYFASSISASQTFSVYYRYIDAPVAAKQSSAFSGLELSLGGSTSLGLSFDLGFGTSKSSLYGLNLKSNFGQGGLSHYGGMMYFGNSLSTAGSKTGTNVTPLSGLKQFITQSLASTTRSGARFHADFQDIAKDFGAFQALKDANASDKTALAQLAILEKQKGLQRIGFGLGLAAPKGAPKTALGLNLQSDQVSDGKGSLNRQTLSYDTGKMGLEIVSRKIDKSFGRIVDLSDDDKTSMALDIRRQFDPSAQAAAVTKADRDQMIREVGLDRTGAHGVVAVGKTNAFNFSEMSLKPTVAAVSPGGGVQRESLGYTTKFFQISLVDQSIANSFGLLPSLSDIEKAQFGNEHGLQRKQMAMAWQLSKLTKIGFTDLHLGTTDDYVRDTVNAAIAAKTDPAAASKAARVGLDRKSINLDTKGFSLLAHESDVDKNFARSADLALTAPEKAAIEADRGFKHSDITSHLAAIKGLTLDTVFSDAVNAIDNISHDTHKVTALYNYGKYTKFTMQDDADLTKTAGLQNGTEHSNETFVQNLGKGFMLNLFRDSLTTFAGGAKTADTSVQDLKFDTPQMKFGSMSYEDKRISLLGGNYEDTSNLNVHLKPTKEVTVNFQRMDIDRGDNMQAGSSAMDEVDVSWQATKQFAVVAGTSQTQTNNNTNADTVSIGLKGDPIKNLTIGAKFDEIHNTINTKDTADFSLSNAKPINYGPISALTVTAKYASLNDQRKLQNETMTGRLAFKMWKSEYLLDYSGITLPNGTSTINRTYSFKTDPDPKRTFHGSFFYKDKTLITGKEALVRNFTADWKLSKETNFVYAFGTSPEDPQGNIRDINTTNYSLKRQLKKNGTVEGFFRIDDNRMTKVLTRSIGCGYDRKVSANSHMSLTYSKDANGLATAYDHSDHLHLGFEQTLSADHFLTLSTEIRSHDQVNLQQQMQVNLDFRTRF